METGKEPLRARRDISRTAFTGLLVALVLDTWAAFVPA